MDKNPKNSTWRAFFQQGFVRRKMTDCFSHGSRVLKVFQIKKLSWQAQGSISHLEIKECIMSPTRFTYRFYTLSEFELEESRSVEKRVLKNSDLCVMFFLECLLRISNKYPVFHSGYNVLFIYILVVLITLEGNGTYQR